MSKQSTLDIELLNLFYLGSYDGCISKCTKISNPTISNRIFEFRSNIALGQYQYVLDEIEEKQGDSSFINDTSIKAIQVFTNYKMSDSSEKKRESIEQIEQWLDDPSRSSNPTLQVLASIIYSEEGNFSSALKAVHNASNLEMHHIYITTLLRMNRVDLAESALKKMQDLNDDATLTQLTHAMVNLAVGGPQKVQDAQFVLKELLNMFPDSVIILNSLATSYLILGDFENAEQYLQSALTKKSNDTVSLVNMIVCQIHLKNEKQVKRFTTQLKSLESNHPWFQSRKEKQDEFDSQKANYSL